MLVWQVHNVLIHGRRKRKYRDFLAEALTIPQSYSPFPQQPYNMELRRKISRTRSHPQTSKAAFKFFLLSQCYDFFLRDNVVILYTQKLSTVVSRF